MSEFNIVTAFCSCPETTIPHIQHIYSGTEDPNHPGGLYLFGAAAVPDVTRIAVDVGLGFHADLTLREATAWLPKKIAALTSAAETLTKRAAELRFRAGVFF